MRRQAIIMLLLALLMPVAWANDGVMHVLRLAPNAVSRAAIAQQPDDQYVVILELKEACRAAFARFTEARIGERLDLRITPEVRVQARIMVRIDTGQIQLPATPDRSEAQATLETIWDVHDTPQEGEDVRCFLPTRDTSDA